MTQVMQNVSDTAFMVAGFRAAENERPNPLFRDPLAARLAGEHGGEILATMPYSVVGAWSVVIRTVIIDELITRAIGEGVDTVLNLGAGLDTRPYRMALPEDLRWVEVDYPHVIGFKESRLTEEAPRCRLKRIELDLTDREALRRFLADMSARATKVLVLTEGVVPYLTETDVTGLAGDLRREEKIRYWITEDFSPPGDSLRRQVAREVHAQCSVSVQARRLVRLFRRLGLASRGGALRLGRRREAQAAHPAAVTREAVTGACGPVRLARPSGRHEALRSLYVPRSGLSRLAAELVPVMASNHRRHPMTKPASDGSMAPHGDQEAN